MPRVMIKGGIWRNTEDEILKAAVMKYGKNQWSRVASLLHRKSAKQCKARWFEWLDPSIKKTEWSRDEDERLLHLAKLMPTQWRTIAPIVGRTAPQCLERYEHLIDEAQRKDDEDSESNDDPRKLRPGEIDPNPETKPARPDPKDMEEDELEMLSEARARLANTKGKKAKRKAREKMLEEARRLASLQKRRELRMAGIDIKKQFKKRRVIDYNKEIPFEKAPVPGFYSTVDESFDMSDSSFQRNLQQKLNEAQRDAKEKQERISDGKKLNRKKGNDLPLLTFFNEPEPQRKRSKLVLPSPQISDVELERVVKLGRVSDSAKEAAEATGSDASRTLLSDYTLNQSSEMRTPRTSFPVADKISRDVQNLLALNNVETPLKGGMNTPLHDDIDFRSSVPRTNFIPTPNTVLASPFNTPEGRAANTPFYGSRCITAISSLRETMQCIPETPVRDKLNINTEGKELPVPLEFIKKEVTEMLKDKLRELPIPKNDYEIVVPELTMLKREVEDEEESPNEPLLDDMDENKKTEAEKLNRRKEEFKKLSQPVQRNLPRPINVNSSILRSREIKNLTDFQKAEELIKAEMILMQHHDALVAPAENQVMSKKSGSIILNQSKHLSYLEKNPYEDFSIEELSRAGNMIQKETVVVKMTMDHGSISLPNFCQVWEECLSEVTFVPEENRHTRAAMTSKKNRLRSLEKTLEINRNHMITESKKAGKLEKKVGILTRGYQMRSFALQKQLEEINGDLEKAILEKNSFLDLKDKEDVAIKQRIQALKAEVDYQKRRETELQLKFAVLKANFK